MGTAEGLQKFSKKVLEKGTAPLILSLSQSLLYKHKCNSVISVIALIDRLICTGSKNCNHGFSNVISVIEW